MAADTITTKKMLVAYDPARPDAVSSDFLVPLNEGTGVILFGLKSRKASALGHMVYLGKAITAHDVFAKLVDSGQRIQSVEQTFKAVEEYLRMLQNFKIGNIVGIEACTENACGFRLTKIANMGRVEPKKLP